jgi:ferritin
MEERMLKKSVQDALNDQLNAELFSAYLYYSMSAYLDANDLPGAANWMRKQALEEQVHVQKFYNYIVDSNARVIMKAIEAPETEWESPLAAFVAALEHEQYISGRIHNLVDLARDERDHATDNFLQWFVDEQIEEEATAQENVRKLRLVGGEGAGLYMVDQELAGRVFAYPPPALTAGA